MRPFGPARMERVGMSKICAGGGQFWGVCVWGLGPTWNERREREDDFEGEKLGFGGFKWEIT